MQRFRAAIAWFKRARNGIAVFIIGVTCANWLLNGPMEIYGNIPAGSLGRAISNCNDRVQIKHRDLTATATIVANDCASNTWARISQRTWEMEPAKSLFQFPSLSTFILRHYTNIADGDDRVRDDSWCLWRLENSWKNATKAGTIRSDTPLPRRMREFKLCRWHIWWSIKN